MVHSGQCVQSLPVFAEELQQRVPLDPQILACQRKAHAMRLEDLAPGLRVTRLEPRRACEAKWIKRTALSTFRVIAVPRRPTSRSRLRISPVRRLALRGLAGLAARAAVGGRPDRR